MAKSLSKTGITKFGTRDGLDVDNIAPTGTNSIELNSSDVGSNKPKLVIEYTFASGSSAFFLNLLS